MQPNNDSSRLVVTKIAVHDDGPLGRRYYTANVCGKPFHNRFGSWMTKADRRGVMRDAMPQVKTLLQRKVRRLEKREARAVGKAVA